MREYGKVHTSFWTSPTIRGLGDDARTLALYLLTCGHGSIIGAFRLPAAYACDDLGWEVERFKNGFRTLEKAGFAIYCRATQWVCIVKFMEWNPAENPNQRKAFEKALAAMPATCFAEGLRNGSVTVPEPAVAVAVGTAAGAGGADAPAPRGRKRSVEQGIVDWLGTVDGDAIPADDPVFAYADKIGLPREFLALAWSEFEARHVESCKTYKDWRSAFRKCVRENWYRLWWEKDGAYSLTTAGVQAQRAAA